MSELKRKFLLLSVVFLTVCACGGFYYYDLQTEIPENNDGLKLDKVLLVENVEINQTYWNQSIVYRDSPFRVKYANFALWSKAPGELIEDAVVLFWKRRAIFKRVSADGHADDHDWSLRLRVDAVEKYLLQKKWYARLALDAEMIDAKSSKTLLLHSFDRKMALPGKETKHLPEVIARILHEELLKIEEKLKAMK